MKIWRCVVIGLLIVMVAGCAINNKTFLNRNENFIEGQKLIEQGQFEIGLEKIQLAAREQPEDKEIRAVVMRLSDEIAMKLMFFAENNRFSGDLASAEKGYQRILNMFPANERAKEGLELIRLDRRHIAIVETAKQHLTRNNVAEAETIVRAVLQENPQQMQARQLIEQINAMMTRPEVTDLALESAFKKNVSMEFKDTDLRSVFEIMSRTAGINFVFDKDIRQETKVSIFVRKNTIEDILKLLLTTNQLAYKVLNNNTLLIYPNTPAKLKDYQELVVKSFQIAHTDVKQMVAMVRGIVKAKDIYVNEQLNLFVMRDTLEAIRLTERLVTLNDLAEPEVILDVAILEISRSDSFLLGPNFPQSLQYSWAGAVVPPTAVTGALISQFGFEGLKSFGMTNQAQIDFMQNLSTGDILANPRIRVSNREKAKIHIGEKRPFFTANVQPGINSVVTSTPTFVDLGVKLDVEPRIGLNNDVTMKVTLEVSTRISDIGGPSGAIAPLIGTRNAETILTLKDGETQVLAGLVDNRDTKSIKGLAGLLNIPGLDRLTSNQKVERAKSEIVLLITPRIVRNLPRPTNMENEYHFGTASEAGKLPVKIQRTATQSLAIAPAASGAGSMRGAAANPFAAAAEQPPADVPNPFANAANVPPSLTLQGPGNVGLDKEFSVNLRLVGAKPTVNSDVQLSYESSALELLDGGPKSGSRTLKLGQDQVLGMATQLRFKVITTSPGSTEISVQNATGENIETGESVEVTLPTPITVTIK
ncbi:MAG: secretin and TonB N-terminal domain-containing protein [Nitrosomonas sp.]|nr:secretin and TonB N-terminal domain-containing protein [Nitrosomonas sp.]